MAHLAAVREAKAEEMGRSDLRAVFFHPDMGANLTAQLLIDTARASLLCKLVWHWATEDHLPTWRRAIGSTHLDKDANVEGAS